MTAPDTARSNQAQDTGNRTPPDHHLVSVDIEGFRSIIAASFRPGAVSALVGEASTGKSNVLAAIRSVLDPEAAPVSAADVAAEGSGTVRIAGHFADGSVASLAGTPPDRLVIRDGAAPPTVFIPADMRTELVVAPSEHRSTSARRAAELLRLAAPEAPTTGPPGATEAARGLVHGIESCVDAGLTGLILLVEEPELFLPPQSQRYLYRLLRNLALAGNQVIYTTHSPSFLNVARLEELVLIERRPDAGTRLFQPESLPADEEFRAISEFDAARSELFLAKAVILVEGLTEKLALPFVFQAMGHDPDRERISIIECGGKPNIPLIGGIAKAVGIPFVVLHDRDAPEGKKPIRAERRLNQQIREIAGAQHQIQMIPDFEGISGLKSHRHKPAQAWRAFAGLTASEVPPPLARAVERAVALARG